MQLVNVSDIPKSNSDVFQRSVSLNEVEELFKENRSEFVLSYLDNVTFRMVADSIPEFRSYMDKALEEA